MRELIELFEGNFKQYNQLLNKLEGNPYLLQSLGSNAELQEKLSLLTDIQDEIVDFRLKKIISEEHPYLPRINPEHLKQYGIHRQQPLQKIILDFLQQRRALIKLLHALPLENWERTGVHEDEGHISFKELVRRMIEKDRKILEELKQALMVQHT